MGCARDRVGTERIRSQRLQLRRLAGHYKLRHPLRPVLVRL